MEVVELKRWERPPGGSVCALGFFDGVHLGHRAILQETMRVAKEEKAPAIAFTFATHPLARIKPEFEPPLLTSFEEKVALIRELRLAHLAWVDFTEGFSHQTPQEFTSRVIVDKLGAKVVIIGPNYRFGYKARGDPDLLIKLGKIHGFAVRVVSSVTSNGQMISSTFIRQLINEGDVAGAALLLSRPYTLTGRVVHGKGRGKSLGAPTANICPPEGKVLPREGVYAVLVRCRGLIFPAMAYLGTSPTFGDKPLTLEVTLLDESLDLYEVELSVDFIDRIRDDIKFAHPQVLASQIQKDRISAREILSRERMLLPARNTTRLAR